MAGRSDMRSFRTSTKTGNALIDCNGYWNLLEFRCGATLPISGPARTGAQRSAMRSLTERLAAAVENSREHDDLGAASHMLMLLGETQKSAGMPTEAMATLEEGLRLAQGVGIQHLQDRIKILLTKLADTRASAGEVGS
jgi:hypothetical protein